MASTPVSANPSLPASAGVAVVPGMSAGATTAPAAPVAPGTGVTGGGAAVDPAQLLILLTTLLTLLQQMPGVQGAQLGAAGVQGGGPQGGGPSAVPLGGPSFAPTTMGSLGAFGATAIETNPFGGAFGQTVGGVSLGAAPGTTTSLSTGNVPSFMPSLGTITGGGGSFGAPASGPSFAPTTFGNFMALSPSSPTTTNPFGSSSFGTSTVGGIALGGTPAAYTPVAGGGAAAAPAAAPQIDMRRVLGTPRSGDVIDTIIRSAMATAQPSKSEGQYIVIQDANGAQLQAHVHGAWSAHPTRIAEGIQRGYLQVHVHEDGTLHLHDVA